MPSLLTSSANGGRVWHLPGPQRGSIGSSAVKNPPEMQGTQDTWVPSLDWGDTLEENMGTHSSCPCWENPMDRGTWWIMDHGVEECQTRLKWVSVLTTPRVDSSFSHWIIIPVHPLASQSFSDMYCYHSFLHNFTPKVSLTIKAKIS